MASKRKSMMQLQREKLAKQRAAKTRASKPAAKPAPKALPPGKKGGPMVSGGARPKPSSTRVTPTKVRDVTPKPKALPPGKPKALPAGKAAKALPAGKAGGALAKAAKTGGRLRGGGVGRQALGAALLTGIVSKAGDTLNKAANPKEWERVQKELKDRRAGHKPPTTTSGTRSRRGAAAATRPTAKPAAKPAAKTAAKPKVADYTDAQGNVYDGNKGHLKSAAKPKPAPKPQASSGGGNRYAGTQPGGSPRGSSPAAKPSPKSNAGMKNQDKNYRGNLFEKTFGYKKGEAPDQKAKRANYAGKNTGVNPSTKVDGSKFKGGSATNKTNTAYSKNTNLLDKKPNSITAAAKKREEEKKKRRGY